ncbi:alpha-L-Rha alpha-1,3-L-rhamnosyltransferase [Carnobacterium maltaromaticum]|nr:alpha-L-Rha alpha-1,3-L-rhamnosyltransferase [Carnobacterium maltaromaticum]
MISVCMATYNGSSFIKRQLDSIVTQLHEGDEIIIVDDCSSDGTVEIITNDFKEINIRLFVNEFNLGSVASFEKAIKYANGEYIFLADQDDIWLENKVEIMKNSFTHETMLVVHDAYVVDGELNILNNSWNNYNKNTITNNIILNFMKNGFTGCMMAFKRELVTKVLPFPKNIEMHDQWIAQVCMLNKFKIVKINLPLMYYVRHGGNVTGMKKRSLFVQIRGRFKTLKNILRYRKITKKE